MLSPASIKNLMTYSELNTHVFLAFLSLRPPPTGLLASHLADTLSHHLRPFLSSSSASLMVSFQLKCLPWKPKIKSKLFKTLTKTWYTSWSQWLEELCVHPGPAKCCDFFPVQTPPPWRHTRHSGRWNAHSLGLTCPVRTSGLFCFCGKDT